MSNITRRRPRVLLEDEYSSSSDYSLGKSQQLATKEEKSDKEFRSPKKFNIFGYSNDFSLDKYDYLALAILTALSLFTRLYKIGKRDQVTWDESHFGKFGAYYLNRTFYHDVHPPLAKMLVGLAELIAGHNGTFNFKGRYPKYVNYTFMRVQIAMYGVFLVPIAYVTLRAMNLRKKYCLLGATFILFDNALCVMSRFILLDEPLLFFTGTSLMFAVLFFTCSHKSFSPKWYIYLLLTGFNLGCVLSSKWVGLFCVALVGLATVEDLFEKFGDLKMDSITHAKHWGSRIVGLIVIPTLVYMLCFKIHFMILDKSGTGDKDMFPAFQVHLKGNHLGHQPYLIALGSEISIRSMQSGAGYLHSHSSKYPSGSLRQQVTCYGFDDNNSKFIIEGVDEPIGFNYTKPTDGTDKLPSPRYVLENQYVRLFHQNTKQYLTADNSYNSIVEAKHKEVSCIDPNKNKNVNSDIYTWQFVFVKDSGVIQSNKLKTISVVFMLKNKATGLYLSAPGSRYPPWGFDQSVVVAQKEPTSDAVEWVIERHATPLLADTAINVKKPSFLKSFIYLNFQMAKTNNGLVPDREKYNHLESDPITWPFLIFPMRLNGSWHNGEIKYYQIGNPFTWWSSTVGTIMFPLTLLILIANSKRNAKNVDKLSSLTSTADLMNSSDNLFSDEKIGSPIFSARSGSNSAISRDANICNRGYLNSTELCELYWNQGKFLWFGWFLHYMPFFLMGRVTYMHHYLPAQYFSYLLLAFELEFFSTHFIPLLLGSNSPSVNSGPSKATKKVGKFVPILVFSLYLALSITGFLIFMPYTFGYVRDPKNLKYRQWLPTWNIYDSYHKM
ncbi:Dolichyl-phosphate-mannose-protein mannosyltransferase 2 [Smittium culicis]|uniref:Dolichyl-phosphate-mannose--protein mannosyltransferase n=1 Tax=Smittium culicis TaxID=133412 RepID=A0A1R1X2A2_9FUNG|nr:Dolichyl-phosphate-mannose-protein mannosyltransferase 2 [Smittium culicis]OMJ10346.1 Dolichyl-phosphate-mannose-protein mannosyltransferase 2 [Smittium culicis]OMJ21629.1 Dolichyl-phosphate-mannose-protein mannosyltransferase 2 [Smittium culicis]